MAVVRGGAVAYSRGYGMADLEHDAIITPLFGNAFEMSTQPAVFVVRFREDALTLSDRGVYRLRFARVR